MQLLIQMPQLQRLLPLMQSHLLTLQTFKQLMQVNRLLVVIGNPGTQGLDHILLVRLPGQHDRFKRAMLAGQPLKLLNQLNPVQARHVQIAEHQTDVGVVIESFDGLMAGLARHTTVTVALKKFAEFFNDQGLVIDHKDFYCRGTLVHVQLPARSKADRSCIHRLRLYNSCMKVVALGHSVQNERLAEPGQRQ
ncbi:hypothetical protein D3C86_973930 [compost metagenome]